MITASCLSKKRYGCRRSAQNDAARHRRMLNEDVVAYPCKECDGWHVGRRRPATEKALLPAKA